MQYKDVIDFWFSGLSHEDWFAKNETLDREIEKRFLGVHQQANKGELFSWRKDPYGRLAEVIVLDQFSRNIYRDKAGAFASDAQALILSQEAISLGIDKQLKSDAERSFLYMPFMHSESLLIQDECLKLFGSLEADYYLDYAVKHRDIIKEYGRYPYRNEILGRASTQAEEDYFKNGGQTF